MRRTPVAAAALLLVAASAGAAYADGSVTDVVVAPAVAGVLTIAGVGATADVPLTASATIGTQGSPLGTTSLTVTDARGVTTGWQVTAKYVDPSSGDLSAAANLLDGTHTTVQPMGAGAISVTAAAVGNDGTTGVANANADWGVDRVLTTQPVSLVTVKSVNGVSDGRGVTAFTTSYRITLPAKSASVAVLYMGTVEYTVGPKTS
jgi:hypothetical protein